VTGWEGLQDQGTRKRSFELLVQGILSLLLAVTLGYALLYFYCLIEWRLPSEHLESLTIWLLPVGTIAGLPLVFTTLSYHLQLNRRRKLVARLYCVILATSLVWVWLDPLSIGMSAWDMIAYICIYMELIGFCIVVSLVMVRFLFELWDSFIFPLLVRRRLGDACND